MTRLILVYGTALAVAAFALEWLDYRHAMRAYSTDFYNLCVALLFAGLGIWVGNRLTARPRGPDFERNDKALASLGISARQLDISPNTVKTHVARVFEKLEVASRVQAIRKARELDILP